MNITKYEAPHYMIF